MDSGQAVDKQWTRVKDHSGEWWRQSTVMDGEWWKEADHFDDSMLDAAELGSIATKPRVV